MYTNIFLFKNTKDKFENISQQDFKCIDWTVDNPSYKNKWILYVAYENKKIIRDYDYSISGTFELIETINDIMHGADKLTIFDIEDLEEIIQLCKKFYISIYLELEILFEKETERQVKNLLSKSNNLINKFSIVFDESIILDVFVRYEDEDEVTIQAALYYSNACILTKIFKELNILLKQTFVFVKKINLI